MCHFLLSSFEIDVLIKACLLSNTLHYWLQKENETEMNSHLSLSSSPHPLPDIYFFLQISLSLLSK